MRNGTEQHADRVATYGDLPSGHGSIIVPKLPRVTLTRGLPNNFEDGIGTLVGFDGRGELAHVHSEGGNEFNYRDRHVGLDQTYLNGIDQ